MALSLDLNRARYELEQRKKARTKSLDRHAKLLADRELMEIKSPADGIVYYGQCVNGRWSDTASLINQVQAAQQRLRRLDPDDDRRAAAAVRHVHARRRQAARRLRRPKGQDRPAAPKAATASPAK